MRFFPSQLIERKRKEAKPWQCFYRLISLKCHLPWKQMCEKNVVIGVHNCRKRFVGELLKIQRHIKKVCRKGRWKYHKQTVCHRPEFWSPGLSDADAARVKGIFKEHITDSDKVDSAKFWIPFEPIPTCFYKKRKMFLYQLVVPQQTP